MDRLKSVVILTALILLIGMSGVKGQESLGQGTTGQVENQINNKPKDTYDFPIKPKTKEWKELGSTPERLKACQIPENILKNMSTEGLIETCLNYPFLGDIYAFNSMQAGFNSLVSKFNGFQELLKRKDAGTKLLLRYSQIRKLDRQSIQRELGEYGILSLTCFEIIISQDVFLSNMSRQERTQLLKECIWKYNDKQKYRDLYGRVLSNGKYILKSPGTFFLMGRILQKQELESLKLKVQNNKNLRDFLQKGSWHTDKTIDEIMPTAEGFVRNVK